MDPIKIITGSQAALTKDLAREYDITLIPYYLNYPKDSLKEGVDFQTEDFYEKLYDIDQLPGTSPPTIGDIVDTLNRVKSNYKEAVVFTLSSKYSQMYNTCQMAIKEVSGINVHLIDSQGATGYQALMVLKAAHLVKQGKAIEDIKKMVETFKDQSDEYIIMDTLKYLAKGGRIGKVKEVMSSLLSIKPIIAHRDGVIVPIAKVRTNQQALQTMISLIKEKLAAFQNKKIWVLMMGVFMDDWLNEVEESLRTQFDVDQLWYTRLSAITSIHFGPKSWSITVSTAE